MHKIPLALISSWVGASAAACLQTLLLCPVACSTAHGTERSPIYKDARAPVELRIDDLLSRMTLDERIALLSGNRMETKANERLGIPFMRMADGPAGVRIWGSATAFPAPVLLAATWDRKLSEAVGAAIGREAKHFGINVMLAPASYIARTPQSGRNFEGFGEDPYLTSGMVAAYVRGMHSEDVMAVVKSMACDIQEYERQTINVVADERTLHEIYLQPFKAAVEQAGCWSIMSAYNRLNGSFTSENPLLWTEIARRQWGFRGFVMSDWGAIHSTAPTLNAGCDLEMPLPMHLAKEKVRAALADGELSEPVVNRAARHILRAMFSMGIFDSPVPTGGAIATPEHRQLALDVARAGVVLLKNENSLLPFDGALIRTVALIGPGARLARTGGGGSSKVSPLHVVSPELAFQERLGAAAVKYASGYSMEGDIFPVSSGSFAPVDKAPDGHGLSAEYYDNETFAGEPVLKRVDPNINFDWQFRSPATGRMRENFSVRWRGWFTPEKTGEYILSMRNDDTMKVLLDDTLVFANEDADKRSVKSHDIRLEGGRCYSIRVEYSHKIPEGWDGVAVLGILEKERDRVETAVAAAAAADAAVVFVGYSDVTEREGRDRSELHLPAEQVKIIQAVARANRNTVVVLHSGAQVLMDPWLSAVGGLVQAWYPGQEGGRALVDILFGDVDPSGRLPMTFMKRWEDHPAFGNYPGEDGVVRLAEGIFVGYRHFDRENIEPLFPFGYGLSYATFGYSDLQISTPTLTSNGEITTSVTIENTGLRSGTEVVQLYIQDHKSSVPRPAKELKGFERVVLSPGGKSTVRFTISPAALAFYDVTLKCWRAEPGTFSVMIGSSSRDIRLQTNIELLQEWKSEDQISPEADHD